jgi:hypothetical protein
MGPTRIISLVAGRFAKKYYAFDAPGCVSPGRFSSQIRSSVTHANLPHRFACLPHPLFLSNDFFEAKMIFTQKIAKTSTSISAWQLPPQKLVANVSKPDLRGGSENSSTALLKAMHLGAREMRRHRIRPPPQCSLVLANE